MSKTNNKAWKTKYGPRRVRQEAPTLEEAIAAAQGLTDEPSEQAEIAASLMGLPQDEVRAVLLTMPQPRKAANSSVVIAGSASAPRTIVVERKLSRRVPPAADRVPLRSGQYR